MRTIDLNGAWEVERVGHSLKVPASVPGQVQMDLLRAGEIEDPYWRDRETEYVWIGQSEWEYRRTFSVDDDVLAEESVKLICEGLDTVAAISINGESVASTDNMFRRYSFEVKPQLVSGENSISIRFRPPMKYAAERAAKHPYQVPYSRQGLDDDHNFVRKSGTHFGWDWGPYMYAVGIWRPIRLEATSEVSLTHMTTHQDHSHDGSVVLRVRAFAESPKGCKATFTAHVAGANVERSVELSAGESVVDIEIGVKDPELWWPAGYGDQKLYDLELNVVSAGGESDQLTQRIGFRTLDLVREKDKHGESFYFKANGVAIYAKGANWIPTDSFDERVTYEVLSNLLTSARDANMNLIRVWGGGIYEQDAFYDLCDELGLMVWQDFMFACALYPADDKFLANVEAEARHQVRRIMFHPCVAMWCGNNENEQALNWYSPTRKNRDRYLVDYSKLYIDTLARVAREEDPGRTYWPSSPSNGVQEWGDPQDQTRGDVHYWNVWHGGKPFSDYLTVCPRFSSEFGFQSFPSVESLSKALGPEDWNVTSPIMEYRQRSGSGNRSIIQHTAAWFRMPEGFENFVYISQALQALSLKTGIEHWRRLKPLCMGTVYWQINDIWQGPSWSSLEYDGRWKMLHYYARRFFAQVLVSAYEDEGALQVWLTSDHRDRLDGELEVVLWGWDGKRLESWKTEYSVEGLGSMVAWSMKVDEMLGVNAKRQDCFVTMSAVLGGESVENLHFLAPPKQAPLAKCNIKVEVTSTATNEAKVTLVSDQPAPFVFLSTAIRGRFSDNGMLLMPQQKCTVTFHGWDEFDVAEFEKSLTVKSLRDSYK